MIIPCLCVPKELNFLSLVVSEGTSLLSGGRESVLVEWRDTMEKNKEFLPRLGATIEHISVSPAGDFFCTSHSDNSKFKFCFYFEDNFLNSSQKEQKVDLKFIKSQMI